jgi:hypothetical protein
MTEEEWLACADPGPMLRFLEGKTSDRKLRLFAVACVRRVLHLLVDERSREAILFAQAHEEGITRSAGRLIARDVATQAASDISARYRARAGDGLFASAHPLYREAWMYLRAANAATLVLADTAFDAARVSSVRAAMAVELEHQWESPKPERIHQAALLHDIFGNPFRSVSFDPEWRTSDAVLLARGIYDDRAFDRMPILADALQDAGCTSDDILNHLRDPHATHVRGCWALDLVLGKE